MKAAVLAQMPAAGFEIRDVAVPRISNDELLIKVDACGVCGTDLHILAGESYRPDLPFTLGHEPVGTVVGTGRSVQPGWMGRRVTAAIFEGCGTCEFCLRADERLCLNLRSIVGVMRRPGAFAEQMAIKASQAIAVPEALSSIEAAALVDAGATAANAADVACQANPATVLVIGGGPVGYLVSQLIWGAHQIWVLETSEVRRLELKRLGLTTFESEAEVPAAPDVVVDCAGAPGTAALGLRLLKPRGTLVLVGYRHEAGIDFGLIARKELHIRGVRSGSARHLREVLDIVSERRIQMPPVSTWHLDEINSALAELRRGSVKGKAVITPN